MARLPSKYDLSQPQPMSGRSGRSIASYDTSAIGRGVASMGASISELGAEITRQRNTVDLARAEAYKTKGFIDTENGFSTDGDYSTFTKRAPEKTGEVVNKAAELIRDPAMREKWKIGAQTDAVRTNDAIGDKARALGQQAETVAFDDALEVNRRLYVDPATSDTVKAKAKADIEAAISTGQSTGLFTPAEAAARRDQFIRNAAFSRAKLYTESNPKEVIGWQGVDVSGDLIEAMATVESTNDNNAVSAKGATGAMQVMPETGVEIARELGDTAFPANGTVAEQQAYLKDPETSIKYGSHYFGKMLKKYGGDEEAALIAYNGGAQRADAWLAAGRDDKAIPRESADYYRKVLSLSGEKPVKYTVDPGQAVQAKQFLQGRTDKDASHIQGMNDTFAVKVARMLQAAPPGIQNDLGIYSGTRTVERQTELWNEELARQNGDVAKARKNVAPPPGLHGSKGSNHNHGLAADLSYKGQSLKNAPPEVVNWLHENAGRFGLKFPLGNENWHVEDDSTRGGRPNVRVASNSPSWFNDLSPEEKQVVYNQAETRQRQTQVAEQGNIETVVQNAPVAMQNTGSYSGQVPTQQQFMDAYGPQEGSDRYAKFTASMDVGAQSYNFRTMSTQDIEAAVAEAKPTSSGNDAALETSRYETLANAAESTIKARQADPAAYARQAFPSVNRAWETAVESGNYQQALTETANAQRQLGIENMRLMPKDVADGAVTRFKDSTAPEQERISALTGLIFSTPDATQQRAVFNQLVAAGLPDTTEGAMDAYARGDEGAGRRLMEAAIIDPSKLPGVAPFKPSEIDAEIQSQIMDEGQIGDLVYGLSDGTIENQESAIRDAKLLTNAVNIRVRNGETLDAAVQSAAKDLYGDIQAVTGNGDVNAQIVLPTGTDPAPVLDGLAGLLPTVRGRLEETVVVPPEAGVADGGKAILQGVRSNYIDNVMAEGYFRNSGDGFVFIDPFVGAAVAGPDGKPLIFTDADILAAPRPAPRVEPGIANEGAAVVQQPQTQQEIDQETYGEFAPMLNSLSGGN